MDAGSVRSGVLRARPRTPPRAACSRQRGRQWRKGALIAPFDSDARDPAAALLERLEITCRLRADQLPEPERLPGDRDLLAGRVDDLEIEAGRGAALVQLPGRVQVAGPEPVRDDAAGRLSSL